RRQVVACQPVDRPLALHDRGRRRDVRIDTTRRYHRDRAPGARGGEAGCGIDDVMQHGATARPAPDGCAGGCDAAAPDADHLPVGIGRDAAVFIDAESPAPWWRGAGHGNIATKTDEHPTRLYRPV